MRRSLQPIRTRRWHWLGVTCVRIRGLTSPARQGNFRGGTVENSRAVLGPPDRAHGPTVSIIPTTWWDLMNSNGSDASFPSPGSHRTADLIWFIAVIV